MSNFSTLVLFICLFIYLFIYFQGSFYQHISTLEPYLKQLQNGVKLPDKNVGRYKIDTITL